MLDPTLGTQSLGRDLTQSERVFADALEAIFKDGVDDYAVVASRLAEDDVALPSGGAGPWTQGVLLDELERINASHDRTYADHGRGA